MSKKSKKIASDLKRRKKASTKAAQQAKYESYRDSGRNSKSKRFIAKSKSSTEMRPRTHPYGKCGNIGCKSCFPQFNYPELIKGLKGLGKVDFEIFNY